VTEGRPEEEQPILVTGVCGGLGRVFVRRILEAGNHPVIGIDKRNWVLDVPARFTFQRADLRRSGTEDVFRTHKPWGVVHLAFVSDQRVAQVRRHEVNVLGTQRLLAWCSKHGVERVVVLSRASVYGARADNPSLITEDMPIKLGAAYSELADLVEYDHLCRSFLWEQQHVEMKLLRPVSVVGPNIREGMLHSYLDRDPVFTALGFDPMVQLIHEGDVVDAILLALTEPGRGIYNLTGPDPVPLSVLLRELGKRRMPVPHPLLAILDRVAFRLRLSPLPPQAIDFLRFNCLVDGTKLREELGFESRHDARATIEGLKSRSAIVA
jgi:UDP-glucose 4-epimerase